MNLNYFDPKGLAPEQHITVKTKVIELENIGISTSFYNPSPHELVLRMDAYVKELIPQKSTKTVEYENQFLTVPYSVPANKIDYLRKFLISVFPYLTAPAFQPEMKTKYTSASVLIPTVKETTNTVVYVKKTRFEICEYRE